MLVFGLLAAASSLTLSGCDDLIEPHIWGNFPDTVDLYSLARGEYVDRVSAYNLLPTRQAIVVEQLTVNPFGFDFAVSENDAGEFIFLPTGVFPDATVRPGLMEDDTASFDGLRRAPRDGYITEEPVVAETGGIYVVRSRQDNRGCYYYGKMEVLELDPAGIATVRILANVNCSDRSLVPNAPPPEDEEETEGEGEG